MPEDVVQWGNPNVDDADLVCAILPERYAKRGVLESEMRVGGNWS